MRRMRPLPLLAAIVIAIVLALAPMLAHAEDTASDAPTLEITTLDGLAGKVVGTPTGSTIDLIVKRRIGGIQSFSYFGSNADMVGALVSGKVDAFITDEPAAQLLVSRNTGIAILPEPVQKDNYGFVLPKGSPHTQEFNRVIEKFKGDGTLDALKAKWCGSDESAKVVPAQDWDAPNGTLAGVTDSTNEPMSYIKDGDHAGYSIELALLCCKELGYKLQLREMGFDAVLASVESGKADLAIGSISITEERRSVMDLTVPMYDGAITVVVRAASGAATEGSFLQGLAKSFERTFITENRWQLVVAGLGITVLIAVSSALLGTLLGYTAMRWRHKGRKVVTKVVDVCEVLLGRLPIAVVLMVFYYVVFGSINIPGAAVAIVVFTLSFAAGAESVMWNAVTGIDAGQREASLALGFTENQTFRGVVLPQAAQRFLPLLKGNFIGLIKDTSVVGFIAVTDLTRAGDLIRSRTMEAFFPLLAVAAIYFVACTVLAWVVQVLIQKVDPKGGPRTIKGVEL